MNITSDQVEVMGCKKISKVQVGEASSHPHGNRGTVQIFLCQSSIIYVSIDDG